MKHILKVGLAALLVTLAVATSGVSADDVSAATGLTISPASLDIEVAPGSKHEGTMHVINESDTPVSYDTYVTPYSVTGEEYKPYFTPIENAIDATKWFSLGKNGGSL